jgi:hypothetical protein
MWEVPSSNSGRDNGYPGWGFQWFFSVPTRNVWLVPGLRHFFFPNPFQFISRPPWTINSHFIFCTNYFLLCSVDCSQISWKSILSFKSVSKSNCIPFYYCISKKPHLFIFSSSNVHIYSCITVSISPDVGRSFRNLSFVLRYQKVEYMKAKAVLVLKPPHQVRCDSTTPRVPNLGIRRK